MSMSNQEQHGNVLEAERTRVKPPPLYKVVLLNDDYTPMDFVVVVLQTVFSMSREKATHLHAGSRVDQGRPGHQPRAEAPAPVAMHDGGDLNAGNCSGPHGAARRAGNGFRRGNEVKEAT
jgi:hypothetical protein